MPVLSGTEVGERTRGAARDAGGKNDIKLVCSLLVEVEDEESLSSKIEPDSPPYGVVPYSHGAQEPGVKQV